MEDNRNGTWKITGVLLGSFITVITLLSLFITSGLRSDIGKMDNKVMLHLTNHEIHNPRQNSVSKAEFETYKYFVDSFSNDIKRKLDNIEKGLYAKNQR